MQERLTYTINNGVYVGRLTNIPAVAQADSLEDLKHKLREAAEIYISMFKDILSSDEPFELEELTSKEFLYRDNPEIAELKKYKDLFGEI